METGLSVEEDRVAVHHVPLHSVADLKARGRLLPVPVHQELLVAGNSLLDTEMYRLPPSPHPSKRRRIG